MRPGWLKAPATAGRPVLVLLLAFAAVLASAGLLFASTRPDGLERLAELTGLAAKEKALFAAPLADYRIILPGAAWIGKAAAGLTGLVLAAAVCVGLARWFSPGSQRLSEPCRNEDPFQAFVRWRTGAGPTPGCTGAIRVRS